MVLIFSRDTLPPPVLAFTRLRACGKAGCARPPPPPTQDHVNDWKIILVKSGARRPRAIYIRRAKLTLTSFPHSDHIPLSQAKRQASYFHASVSSHNSDFHMKYSHAAPATVIGGEIPHRKSARPGTLGRREDVAQRLCTGEIWGVRKAPGCSSCEGIVAWLTS